MRAIVKIMLLGGLLVPSVLAEESAPVLLEVTGSPVNLRSRPSLTGEVTGQVQEGARLEMQFMSEQDDAEWVAVKAPDSVECWVKSLYLEEGEVVPAKLNVRAGPSLNYGVIGLLKRGDPVELRGTRGDWAQIAPPPGSVVWISADFVKVVPPPAAKPSEPPAEPAEEKPAGQPASPAHREPPEEAAEPELALEQSPADVVSIPTIEEVAAEEPPTEREMIEQIVQANTVPEISVEADQGPKLPLFFELDRSRPQKQPMKSEGMLRKSESVLLHRLVDGQGKTVCLIRGNQDQMKKLLGTPVRMEGAGYRIRQVELPVMIPQRIVLLPEE